MTTFEARDHRIQTYRVYKVTDGPVREFAFGKFKVDQVGVFVAQHAYPDDRLGEPDINVYLSGPITDRTTPKTSESRDRVESQVVPDPAHLGKAAKAWLGPIIENAQAVHSDTMRAVSL